MVIAYSNTDSAIVKGIKTVGVGKKGSKSLDPILAEEILADLQNGLISEAAKGAFFGGLISKGVTADEMILDRFFGSSGILSEPVRLADALLKGVPSNVQILCRRVLEGQELSLTDAEELGDFLLSEQPGDAARGLVASVLRVRYETPDEYEGLSRSIHKTLEPAFRENVPHGVPVVQLAEPFDGVDHSNMITPLLAEFIRQMNYRPVVMVGRNSGPKFGNNGLDLATCLQATFVDGNADITNDVPPFGFYVHQADLSKAVDRWVDIRHQTVKRPFMSTIERFINACGAQIVIASAFHPPYGEKMLTVAERNGFPGAIIVRNGLEGTLAFPLLRSVKVLCSVRQADGGYKRQEFNFDPQDFGVPAVEAEERLQPPSLKENIRLINDFAHDGHTDNHLFDARVRFTCEGLRRAIEWVSLSK